MLKKLYCLLLITMMFFVAVPTIYAENPCDNPPPPSPTPGGDHADDNYSVSAPNAAISYSSQYPGLAILKEGYFANLSSLAASKKEGSIYSDAQIAVNELLASSKVLVIPSGGLYGLENSAFLKAALDEYVKQGGTLIVFAQQHGYEFSILPVPQEADGSYKNIQAYSWRLRTDSRNN
jgi:hypothetical protein